MNHLKQQLRADFHREFVNLFTVLLYSATEYTTAHRAGSKQRGVALSLAECSFRLVRLERSWEGLASARELDGFSPEEQVLLEASLAYGGFILDAPGIGSPSFVRERARLQNVLYHGAAAAFWWDETKQQA